MGCNQSQSEDVRHDQARQREEAEASVARQRTKPIPAEQEVVEISGGYGDKRERENDFFKEIIERTSKNLIDVTQAPAPLEHKDAIERVRDYGEHALNNVNINGHSVGTLPITKTVPPGQVLAAPLSANDYSYGCRAMAAALSQMTVRDCGDIVVKFPVV
eukprot:TRINITY_DN7065_c0_g1_i1.p1 TRINITY_DN7065_c0_g1~~TRINITY_DN7065_c0_g1_i1.p1  ORF type:complete len:188 (-),score=44.92 TRINITY_DN7065_c0_g1_i1:101-580(-)